MTTISESTSQERQSVEANLLPPDAAEWRRRVQALTDAMRTARPGRGAMKAIAEQANLPDLTCLCIEGVITTLAEREGAFTGEWTVSDYYAPGRTSNFELPMNVSADNRRLMDSARGAEAAITCYGYCVTTPAGTPDGPALPQPQRQLPSSGQAVVRHGRESGRREAPGHCTLRDGRRLLERRATTVRGGTAARTPSCRKSTTPCFPREPTP